MKTHSILKGSHLLPGFRGLVLFLSSCDWGVTYLARLHCLLALVRGYRYPAGLVIQSCCSIKTGGKLAVLASSAHLLGNSGAANYFFLSMTYVPFLRFTASV